MEGTSPPSPQLSVSDMSFSCQALGHHVPLPTALPWAPEPSCFTAWWPVRSELQERGLWLGKVAAYMSC